MSTVLIHNWEYFYKLEFQKLFYDAIGIHIARKVLNIRLILKKNFSTNSRKFHTSISNGLDNDEIEAIQVLAPHNH